MRRYLGKYKVYENGQFLRGLTLHDTTELLKRAAIIRGFTPKTERFVDVEGEQRRVDMVWHKPDHPDQIVAGFEIEGRNVAFPSLINDIARLNQLTHLPISKFVILFSIDHNHLPKGPGTIERAQQYLWDHGGDDIQVRLDVDLFARGGIEKLMNDVG